MTATSKPTFWQWFDSLPEQYAKDCSEIAEAAKAHNFTIGHTGGGCLALELTVGKCWLLLCDEDNALPTSLDQEVIGGSTDIDEGLSIVGLDKVTPRNFFATCWTFSAYSEHRRALGEYETSFASFGAMLLAAKAAGCVHADERAEVERIIALKD